MNLIRFILGLIGFNLINWFYEILDLCFWQFIDFVRSLDFLDIVGILYKHIGFFQFHQIALLCDHQELACTSKDPPRRVDMKEMSLILSWKNICWVIDKTVWKPPLVTLFENRICALISWLNELYESNVYFFFGVRPVSFRYNVL